MRFKLGCCRCGIACRVRRELTDAPDEVAGSKYRLTDISFSYKGQLMESLFGSTDIEALYEPMLEEGMWMAFGTDGYSYTLGTVSMTDFPVTVSAAPSHDEGTAEKESAIKFVPYEQDGEDIIFDISVIEEMLLEGDITLSGKYSGGKLEFGYGMSLVVDSIEEEQSLIFNFNCAYDGAFDPADYDVTEMEGNGSQSGNPQDPDTGGVDTSVSVEGRKYRITDITYDDKHGGIYAPPADLVEEMLAQGKWYGFDAENMYLISSDESVGLPRSAAYVQNGNSIILDVDYSATLTLTDNAENLTAVFRRTVNSVEVVLTFQAVYDGEADSSSNEDMTTEEEGGLLPEYGEPAPAY